MEVQARSNSPSFRRVRTVVSYIEGRLRRMSPSTNRATIDTFDSPVKHLTVDECTRVIDVLQHLVGCNFTVELKSDGDTTGMLFRFVWTDADNSEAHRKIWLGGTRFPIIMWRREEEYRRIFTLINECIRTGQCYFFTFIRGAGIWADISEYVRKFGWSLRISNTSNVTVVMVSPLEDISERGQVDIDSLVETEEFKTLSASAPYFHPTEEATSMQKMPTFRYKPPAGFKGKRFNGK